VPSTVTESTLNVWPGSTTTSISRVLPEIWLTSLPSVSCSSNRKSYGSLPPVQPLATWWDLLVLARCGQLTYPLREAS
jgi:hypothetical protein